MRRARVLIVDDEAAILESLGRILRRQPYEVFTAESGQLGLELLARTPVDVVVSDERMPGMAGSEFLARVCREHPDTVRIIFTGHATLEAAVTAINEGQIFRFLRKPTDPADFLFTLHAAVQLLELRRESARLLAHAREQRLTLQELERRDPGITTLRRDERGVIDLDQEDVPELSELLDRIRAELADPDRRAA